MKSKQALIERFKKSLNVVSTSVRSVVNKPGGLSENELLDLILNPVDYRVNLPEEPDDSVVITNCDVEKCNELGNEVLARGEVAYCILAGGMETRIGEPKALVRIPNFGMSLLTLKFFQAYGNGPIWVIASPSLKNRIIDHISSQSGLDLSRIRIIEQFESYRLEPDNQISFTDGEPNLYPCGHGDLFPALTSTGTLKEFTERGGRFVCVVNVDNAAAFLDPVSIGRHIISNANVSCEVVEKNAEDPGGVLCNIEGSHQILESFKTHATDLARFKWLNTNSIIFNSSLNIAPLGRTWHRVQKNIDGKLFIQYERLLQEITEAYDTIYFGVERTKRFLPVKNLDDLKNIGKILNADLRLI